MPARPFPFASFEAIPINVHSHNNTSNLGVFGIARKVFGKPIHLSMVKLVICSVVKATSSITGPAALIAEKR